MYCERCGRLAHGDRPCDSGSPTEIRTTPRYTPQSVARHVRRPHKPPVESMLAAILSFFIPGLGQLCQGRFGAGFAFFFCLLVDGLFLLAFWPLGMFCLFVTVVAAVVDAAYH